MLTEARKKLREGRVTASLVPAVLGGDRYKSPRQAFMEITGRAEDDAGQAAILGSCFEDGTLKACEVLGGLKIARRNVWRVGLDGELGATLDAVLQAEGEYIEAKTNWSVFDPTDEWGEPGTDEVPEKVILQVAGQMIAAPEMHTCHVPRNHASSRTYALYRVARDEKLIAAVTDGVQRFIRDHLAPDRAPAVDRRDVETLKLVERQSVKVRLPDELVIRAMDIKGALKALEDKWGDTYAELLERLKLDDGSYADEGESAVGAVTFRKCKDGTKLDVEALTAAHPGIVGLFMKPKPGHRTLRLPKGGAA